MNIRTAPTVVLPGDAPRRNRTTIVLVVLVALCIAAAAVVAFNLTRGDSSAATKATGSPVPPASGVVPTTVFDPQAATKAAIVDAYRQSFAGFVAVASDPNATPDDPRLSAHTVGNALLASQQSITRLRKAGQVFRGTVEVHPSVTEFTADTATVVDCSADMAYVVDGASGQVVEPAGPPGVGSASTATFRLLNGVWMQNTFKDEKRSCALPAS
ncbi:MAG: hypothetical protein M3137_12760 [Actinomycetota bacterium]|nr:hypothetical protein [Actinomycetota bacterium]